MKACTHHSCRRVRELGRQCKVVRRLGHVGLMHQDTPSTRDCKQQLPGGRGGEEKNTGGGSRRVGHASLIGQLRQQATAAACHRAQELHGASNQAGGKQSIPATTVTDKKSSSPDLACMQIRRKGRHRREEWSTNFQQNFQVWAPHASTAPHRSVNVSHTHSLEYCRFRCQVSILRPWGHP